LLQCVAAATFQLPLRVSIGCVCPNTRPRSRCVCCRGCCCKVLLRRVVLQCVVAVCCSVLQPPSQYLPTAATCLSRLRAEYTSKVYVCLLQVVVAGVYVAGCCSRDLLQGVAAISHAPVAVCCSLLQCVALCYGVCCRQGVAGCCRVLQPFHMPQLRCVAACYSILQFVVVCCSVL